MDIGNQIKALRLRRGITQEAMGQHFGVSPQAVSKWERGEAAPDIAMLPELSAYFGVTIDALFSLSDDTRMERIQNMLWDVRYLDTADVETSRAFLLEKAKREPENPRPHELLADMENHLADTHKEFATQYALESMRRSPDGFDACFSLILAQNGKCLDWCFSNHSKLIDTLRECIAQHPKNWHIYIFLMEQLIDDYRFDEAEEVLAQFAEVGPDFRYCLYKGMIAWHKGQRTEAFAIWEELSQRYPEDWHAPQTMGDYYVREGAYDNAIASFRRALEIGHAPRYTDPIDSIAQVYALQGDYPNAVKALKEQLELTDKEWNITEGEVADSIRREIERLEQK